MWRKWTLTPIRTVRDEEAFQDFPVSTTIDAARTDHFLRKMGFAKTGGNYMLEGV